MKLTSLTTSLGNGSSQSTPIAHISCINIFAVIVNGDKNPSHLSRVWCKCFTIFGSVCSTTSCSKVYGRAVETVLQSTYMDDSMDSVVNEKEGIILYKQLSELWEKAGMHAHKQLSNSQEVLDAIPPQDRASQLELDENSSLAVIAPGRRMKMFSPLSRSRLNLISNQPREIC